MKARAQAGEGRWTVTHKPVPLRPPMILALEQLEPSWTWKRIAGHSDGWRIDHIFPSAELQVIGCLYHHVWRDDGLSDHSALEAEFA